MYSVYQHWDPLRVCAVGRSYPPEFYSWIDIPRVRSLFERIAIETEEDYQNIIKKLLEFNVEVVRPNADYDQGSFLIPPMNPRDSMIMIGEKFYTTIKDWKSFYRQIKDPSWPDWKEFENAGYNFSKCQNIDSEIQQEIGQFYPLQTAKNQVLFNIDECIFDTDKFLNSIKQLYVQLGFDDFQSHLIRKFHTTYISLHI
jgi:hypothetical protein